MSARDTSRVSRAGGSPAPMATRGALGKGWGDGGLANPYADIALAAAGGGTAISVKVRARVCVCVCACVNAIAGGAPQLYACVAHRLVPKLRQLQPPRQLRSQTMAVSRRRRPRALRLRRCPRLAGRRTIRTSRGTHRCVTCVSFIVHMCALLCVGGLGCASAYACVCGVRFA
jgi:hypothetical protein